MSQLYTVYQIQNTLTGKRYIGSTGNYELRKYYHLWSLANHKHFNSLLQYDYDKGHYFVFTPLATFSSEDIARQVEKELILDYQNSKEGLYNFQHNTNTPDVMYKRSWNAQKRRKFSLPEAYEMARMKFEENKTYQEIADIYKCHPVTVFWNVNCYLKGVTQYVATRQH